jgi:hypothetical protein
MPGAAIASYYKRPEKTKRYATRDNRVFEKSENVQRASSNSVCHGGVVGVERYKAE